MEIERKYLIKEIPFSLEAYPYKELEQGYISTSPVIRIRKADEQYILTVKSSGLLERQEFELPMNEADYKRLLGKVDGNLVTKRRYIIPLTDTEGTTGDKQKDAGLKIELDVFEGLYQGLIYAEVEFETKEDADSFAAPAWFTRDVSMDGAYHNSALSSMNEEQRLAFMTGVSEFGE